MKTNINIDNYEAYLLDYMDGNLSPDEAGQLKAFVVAQGLDWNELTEALPHLETPQTVYEDKEKLKKKAAVVPLYVKIASAAAAAGLLLTIGLWPEKQMPQVEPIAGLKPISATHIEVPLGMTVLPERRSCVVSRQAVAKENVVAPERREEMLLLAELEPKKAQALSVSSHFEEPEYERMDAQWNADVAFAQIGEEVDFEEDAEYDSDMSFIGKGLYRLTNGRHDSFASLINFGLSKAKQDLSEAATDIALAAYQRAEESFEETRERWEEKRGE